MTKRLLLNKPYWFAASKDEADEISLWVQAVIIAKYFNISPHEIMESWTLTEIKKVLAVIEGIEEAEKEKEEEAEEEQKAGAGVNG